MDLSIEALPFTLVNESIVDPAFVSTRAVACAAGTFFTVIGESERVCQLCPVGSYSSSSGALKCTPCPRGTFAAEERSDVCKVCPIGADAVPGALSCVECSWLTYECRGYWQDLIITIGLTVGLLRVLVHKIRRLCMDGQAQQQQDATIALMAAVRAHGSTLDNVRYAPMVCLSVCNKEPLSDKTESCRTLRYRA